MTTSLAIGLQLLLALSERDPRTYNNYQWNRANRSTEKVDRGDWFEWWYYKVTVPETKEAFYLLYGAVNPWDKKSKNKSSRSYVSFGTYSELKQVENRFSISEMAADYDSPRVGIGPSQADGRNLYGELFNEKGESEVTWNLNITEDWSVNAMGWGIFVPWISNVYWYPAQASAFMNGVITYRGRRIELKNAPAYQDRNWGSSFPKWWAWIVSNHFENSPGTVLAAGGGKPKILAQFFLMDGLTIGFRHQGKEYTFRTTDGDRVSFKIHFGKWLVDASNRRGERILISARAPREAFMILPFQTPQGKVFYDYEALKAEIDVQLFERRGRLASWEKIADLKSYEGGLEYGSHEPQKTKALFSSKIALQD